MKKEEEWNTYYVVGTIVKAIDTDDFDDFYDDSYCQHIETARKLKDKILEEKSNNLPLKENEEVVIMKVVYNIVE